MSTSDQGQPDRNALYDKVVLVTGGSRGMGAAIARRFAAAGSRVAIGYRNESAAADAVLGEIAALGAQGIGVAGDISNPDDAHAMVAQVVARGSVISTFWRIARALRSIGRSKRPIPRIPRHFRHQRPWYDRGHSGGAPVSDRAGGRIINPPPRSPPGRSRPPRSYAASKAAVAALSHALAKEPGPRGITVNTIAPGRDRNRHDDADPGRARRGIAAMTPLGRIGQTDDIAGVALFLASPEAKWLTGRTIIADGGVS